MRNIHILLENGINAQKEKLIENNHKKGFDKYEFFELFDLLVDEVEELKEEIFSENIDINKTRREAADIANFAHMIILKCNLDNKAD